MSPPLNVEFDLDLYIIVAVKESESNAISTFLYSLLNHHFIIFVSFSDKQHIALQVMQEADDLFEAV